MVLWRYGCAQQLLTRLPLFYHVPYSPVLALQSTAYYPLVGLVLGVWQVVAALILSALLPVSVAAIIVLILSVALTGGLHLDGWMDTADGVLSHRSRERMLAIMKDSRVGAMGVIAAVLLLSLQATLIMVWIGEWASLIWQKNGGQVDTRKLSLLLVLYMIVPIWSRSVMTLTIVCWPYAGQAGGLGHSLANTGKTQAYRALGLAVFVTVLLQLAWYVVPSVAGAADLTMIRWAAPWLIGLGTIVGGLLTAWRLARTLGGLTGDTYGVVNEVATCCGLLVLTVLIYRGWLG